MSEIISENENNSSREEKLLCQTCGKQAERSWEYCPYCGAVLEAKKNDKIELEIKRITKEETEDNNKYEVREKIETGQSGKMHDVVSSFVFRQKSSYGRADQLLKYIKEKVHLTERMEGEWIATDDTLQFEHEWWACSFFDDGGTEHGLERWTMRRIPLTMSVKVENDRLQDTIKRSIWDKKDRFYAKDPFGLTGVYEFAYYYNESREE